MNYLQSALVTRYYAFIQNVLFKRWTLLSKEKTLLIVRVDSIGDYVLFRNFLSVIRTSEKYKKYRITLCGNSWWKELSERLDDPQVDEFVWIDYKQMEQPAYRFKIFKLIFMKRFETVIHPTYSRDSVGDGIVMYSGSPYKIGYAGDSTNLPLLQKKKNDLCYTGLIPNTEKLFEFERNIHFFECLLNVRIAVTKPTIEYDKEVRKKIIFFPGAKDEFRKWSPEKIGALASRIYQQFPNYELYIGGAANDKSIADAVIKHSQAPLKNEAGNYSLSQLIEFTGDAALVVCNDSGPFHIATALNRKVIAVSNGNNYGRFSPYPNYMNTQSVVVYPDEIVQYTEQERINKFSREVKEIDINTISVETVYKQVVKFLTE